MYVSQINGGPELRGSTVDRVLARIASLFGGGEEDEFGSLDIVFHVHGSVLSPEHVGVRTGTFSKKRRRLMLQIAVPKHVVENEELEIQRFVPSSLVEAVVMAEPVCHRAKIAYSKEEFLSRIESARRAFIH
jgi:hypothetical protein